MHLGGSSHANASEAAAALLDVQTADALHCTLCLNSAGALVPTTLSC